MKISPKTLAYYHSHEQVYQKLRGEGALAWGGARTVEEMSDPETLQFLTEKASQLFIKDRKLRALDLGCGTGSTAFALAKLGFEVAGVDISPTAIEMANKIAGQLGLKIRFLIQDILQLSQIKEEFDFIYDSHCLHCIVYSEDRKQFLREVKNSLAPGGYFILDTMVNADDQEALTIGDGLYFDEDGILWHQAAAATDPGAILREGQYWCPQRRILAPAAVLNEVLESEFKLESQRLDPQKPNQPSMFRLVLAHA